MMFVMFPTTYYSVSIMIFLAVTATTYFKVDISITLNVIVQYASVAFTGIFYSAYCWLSPKAKTCRTV
jgi:hypothetical protein